VVRDETSMPAQDRLWSDEEHRPAVTTQHARERAQERALGGFEARTRDLALQDRELVAQHEDLDIFRTIPATAEDEQVDHESDKTVETCHTPILAALEPRRSPEHKAPGQRTRTNIRRTHRSAPLTKTTRPTRSRAMASPPATIEVGVTSTTDSGDTGVPFEDPSVVVTGHE
jgi:hypothetical protein